MHASAITMVRQSMVNKNLFAIADVQTEDDTQVDALNLHGNYIRTMEGLQRFPYLVELSLSSNCIECPSFGALRGLSHLRVLNLSANRIMTTDGFPILPSLKELSLAYNRSVDPDFLLISMLNARRRSLTKLSGLLEPTKLPSLEILDLRDNLIAELTGLSPLFYMQNISVVRLQNINKSQANPVCSAVGYPSMLLDRMLSLATLDGEDVDVLKEIASLAMPKYTSVAKLFRPQSADKSKSVTSESHPAPLPPAEWTALDARLRALESHQSTPTAQDLDANDPSLLVDIDAKIKNATHNLRAMHLETLQKRHLVPPPPSHATPITVFVETAQRRGFRLLDDVIAEASSSDDESNASEHVNATFADRNNDQPAVAHADAASQCERPSSRATGSQCDAVQCLAVGVQCDVDYVDAALRLEIAAAVERAKQAETKLVDAAAEAMRSAEALAVVVGERDAARQHVARFEDTIEAERRHHSVTLETLKREGDDTMAASAQRHAAELEALVKQMEAKWKMTSMDMENRQTDAMAKEERVAWQDKQDENAALIRQLKRDLQEMKYTLEDAYAKYAAKEKEVSTLRHDALLKGAEMDRIVVQQKEEWQRREKEWNQREALVNRQFHMTRHEMELEFRLKQSESILKLKQLQQALQSAVHDAKQWEAKSLAAQRKEAGLVQRIHDLTTQLSGVDKKLMRMEDACQSTIRDQETTIKSLEEQIDMEQAHVAQLDEALVAARAEIDQMAARENDTKALGATLQVKNIMLDDQATQLMAARKDADELRRGREEMEDHIRDLEVALDESLRRQDEMEADAARVDAHMDKLEQFDAMADELDAKVAALEYIEKEMARMRKTIAKQEESAVDRMGRLQQEHDEQAKEWHESIEALRQQVLQANDKVAAGESHLRGLKDANRVLQQSVREHQMRVQTTENEMKVLLLQMEKERQTKRQYMAQIGHLLRQLDTSETNDRHHPPRT
ncbi:Aste57867_9838 [Aphanomyces stellatus]|uniref:Aste57867_9838 protein n=1 Tax=Aphanomyces stellatus TaxID=120398 RepID=A0A485KP53_9STRA|nr:hypothetical protein As57867_009799 [Aphanomyces stellatus]VFT86717.1 Aste57867_9838 [Aphanomyces stellatus]